MNYERELRKISATGMVSSHRASEFAVHISIRTRHIRSTFSSAAANFLHKISDELLATPKDFEGFVLRQIRTEPDYLRDAMRGEIRKRGLTELLDEKLVEQWLDAVMAIVPELLPDIANSSHAQFLGTIVHSEKAVPESVKSGHLRVFEKNVAPHNRTKHLERLSWWLCTFPANTLVLGDLGPWAIADPTGLHVPLAWATDGVSSVYFPISHRHLLFGADSELEQQLSPEHINRISATLSLEYFIASIDSESNRACSKLIGTRASEALDGELGNL